MKRYATMLLGLLLSLLIAGQAQAQTEVTVRQINEISQANIDMLNAGGATLDGSLIGPLTASAFTNQEVSIVVVVLSNPRTSGLGNPDADGFPSRIHVYVRDTSAVTMGNEGMGIQLVDGAYQDTGLLNAAIGDVIRVVGVPSAFTGSGGASQQLSPTSIEVLGSMADFNLPASLLDPVVITTDMANKSVGSNGEVQVNWSNLASLNGQYVRLEAATIQVRDISSARPNWLITSDGGVTVFNFYDMSLRYRNDRDGAYNESEFNVRGNRDDFVPPAPGALVNIQGFIVFQGDDPFGRAVPGGALLSLAPFEDDDLEVTESPPNVSALSRPTEIPNTDAQTISADIVVDSVRTLDAATLSYFTSTSAETMTVVGTPGKTAAPFNFEIPGQEDGTFVCYWVTATDNTGASSSTDRENYRVMTAGINSIADIQEYFGDCGTEASPFVGLTVDMSVWGLVMTEQAVTGFISIQSGTDVNSGIIIEDTDDIQALGLVPGDSVFIDAGTIQEIRGADRFDRSGNLTGIGAPTLRQGGASNPYDAVAMTTEALQDSGVAEGMESMLLRVEAPVITSTNSDAPGGPFGEFDISSDGTDDNAFRVDDGSSAISYDGGDPGTVYTTGERLEFVQGILSHSFGNFKLLPRDSTDVGMVTNVAVEDDVVPGSFALRQNYPNPFNPTTAIEYTVPATSKVRLEVFDVLGRSVAVLVNGEQAVGTYTVRFDATRLASGLYLYRLTAGSKVQVKKMLFLK